MKKVILLFAVLSATRSIGQDTTKVHAPAPQQPKLYYFAFPASYVDAIYSNLGVSADNNKSGVSVAELKQEFVNQVNHQPKMDAPVVDTVNAKLKNKKK